MKLDNVIQNLVNSADDTGCSDDLTVVSKSALAELKNHKRLKTLLNHLATALVAHKNCIQSDNVEWQGKWENIINHIERELPSGSGIDSGTKIDWEKSDGRNRIVLNTSYHHINENGMYDGWTEHQVIITPDLLFGFSIKFTGPNRNEIKEYLHDVFHTVLSEDYDDKILAS